MIIYPKTRTFCQIKKFHPDRICNPEEKDMSGKHKMYGNPTFKESRVSLPPLHETAIGPYLEQDLSNLQHHNPPLSNPFNIILPSSFQLPKSLFPLYFPLKLCMHFWRAPRALNVCVSQLSRLLRFLIIRLLKYCNGYKQSCNH